MIASVISTLANFAVGFYGCLHSFETKPKKCRRCVGSLRSFQYLLAEAESTAIVEPFLHFRNVSFAGNNESDRGSAD